VCERWYKFENFIADVGRRPSPQHTLERIDNDKNYEPGNCRWATKAEQNNNKCNNHYVTYAGKRMTLKQAMDMADNPMTWGCIRGRISRGWDITKAIDTPPNKNIWKSRKRARVS